MCLAEPDSPLFYIPTPRRDIVAKDGDEIILGDNTFTLYNTQGIQRRAKCSLQETHTTATTATCVDLGRWIELFWRCAH